ncbi:MAG: hypothetical protein QM747_09765 [Nocardioides sp.]
MVTSLSDRPISEAPRLLVVAVSNGTQNTVQLPATRPANVPPSLIEGVTASVSIRTPLTKVYAISVSGHRTAPIPATRDGDTLTFQIQPDHQAMWYEVTTD